MREISNGSFGGGDGTVGNPYLVEDSADLNAVRNDLSANYKQINNIDLSSYANWEPIGNSSNKFTGSYDGDNYNIQNLTIAADYSSGNDDIALFSWTSGAILENVTIQDFEIKSISVDADNISVLVCVADNTTIENCHTKNGSVYFEVSRYDLDASGLCKQARNECYISNCSVVNVNVEGFYDAAGFLCEAQGIYSETNTTIIEKCFVKDCIITTYNYSAGGFYSGHMQQAWNVKFKNCYVINTEIVAGSGVDLNNGGAGGFVAFAKTYDHPLVFENCYCQITFNEANATFPNKGGFTGQLDETDTSNNSLIEWHSCYYDSNTSEMSDTGYGEPRTTGEMTDPYNEETTYQNWNFTNIWYIDSQLNSGYPVLEYDVILVGGSESSGGFYINLEGASVTSGSLLEQLSIFLLGETLATGTLDEELSVFLLGESESESIFASSVLPGPQIDTTGYSDRQENTVTLNGELINLGQHDNMDVYFEYNTISDMERVGVEETAVTSLNSPDTFSQAIVTDSFNNYYFRAVGKATESVNGANVNFFYYGEIQSVDKYKNRRREEFYDGSDMTKDEMDRMATEIFSKENKVIEIEYLPGGPFDYLTDFDLGDIVHVNYPGIFDADIRIIAVKEELMEEGKRYKITFGQEWPDILNIIKDDREQIEKAFRD